MGGDEGLPSFEPTLFGAVVLPPDDVAARLRVSSRIAFVCDVLAFADGNVVARASVNLLGPTVLSVSTLPDAAGASPAVYAFDVQRRPQESAAQPLAFAFGGTHELLVSHPPVVTFAIPPSIHNVEAVRTGEEASFIALRALQPPSSSPSSTVPVVASLLSAPVFAAAAAQVHTRYRDDAAKGRTAIALPPPEPLRWAPSGVRYDLVIPVGTDCCAASALRFAGSRVCSHPFDWIRVQAPGVRCILRDLLAVSGESLSLFGAPHTAVVSHRANTNIYRTMSDPSQTGPGASRLLCDRRYGCIANTDVLKSVDRRLQRLRAALLASPRRIALVHVGMTTADEDVLEIDDVSTVDSTASAGGVAAVVLAELNGLASELMARFGGSGLQTVHVFAFNVARSDFVAPPHVVHRFVGFADEDAPWENVAALVAKALPPALAVAAGTDGHAAPCGVDEDDE